MTRLWPWLCSDSLCFPAPLSVSCTMDGIYPDDVQHCKRESADPTHYSGCIHPLSALPCRLFVQKNVAWLRFSFFLFCECMTKVTVLCNIGFTNDVCPKWVSLACQWAHRKWEKSSSESLCSGKPPLWCRKATDAPPRLMATQAARCSFWYRHPVCVPSQTCKNAPRGKGLKMAIEWTLSGWGDSDFCNTPEPWPAEWAGVDFQLSETQSPDQAFRFLASCIGALNSNSQRT